MGVQYLLKVAVFLVAGSLAACGGSGGGDDGGGDNQKPPVVNSFQAAPNAADIDTPVTFSWDVSDANGDTLTCTLDVDGDGTADHTISDCANTASQAHTYTAAGSYSATLSVSDGNGGKADRTVTVTISAANTLPAFDSDFSATPNPTTAGSPVTFNWAVSDADGDTLTCSLDVDGDGTADYTISDCANTGSQAHTYATAGDYPAKLTVDDGNGGAVEQTVSMTVDPAASNTAPVFDTGLGMTPNPVEEGSPATFTWAVSDADGDPLTCTLDADGDGGTDYTITNCASNGSQAHTYVAAGSYSATLTVSDGKGGSVAQSLAVTVSAANTAPVFDTSLGVTPNPVEEGSPATFTWAVGDADGDTLTCTLDVDGDSSTDYTITDCASNGSQAHTYIAAGTYSATLTVSDGNGGTVAQTVDLIVDPAAGNTAPVIDSFSTSASPSYTNAATTLVWSVSDADGDSLTCTLDVDGNAVADYTIGDCASNSSQLHTFATAGSHTVRLSVSDGVDTVTREQVVTVVEPVVMAVTMDDRTAVAGERILYTVTVGNRSPESVDGVSVQFQVPAGLTFNYYYDAEPNAASCSACSEGSEATWDLGTLAAGESRSIDINANVAAGLLDGDLLVMPVRVTADGENDTMAFRQVVRVNNSPAADLSLSASTDPVMPGEGFVYRVDLGNISAGAITNGQLRLTLPAGVSVDAVSDGGSDLGGGVVSWDVASLAVGGSLRREVTVTADASLVAGEILQADVELTHDGGLEVDNRADFAVTVVEAAPKLSVALVSATDAVVVEGRVLYTLTVSNTAAVPVNNVGVQLRVPAGLTFNYYYDAEPNAASCSACSEGSEATWDLGTLAAGESRSIDINANVAAGLLDGDLLVMPVRVTADGENDTMAFRQVVRVNNSPAADLSLSASTDPVMPGEGFVYRVDLGNISAGAITNGQLRLTLPAGVSVDAVSDGGSDLGGGVVSWDVASLAVGGSLRREVTVTADASLVAGEILQADVELTHDGGLEVDNRAGFAVTVVDSTPEVSATISATPSPVAPGGTLVYTIIVSNDSARPANAVKVVFRVPGGLSFNYYYDAEPDAAGCSACSGGSEATWDLGVLGAGANQTITINATVDAGLDLGTLLDVPLRVTATELVDTIELRYVTPVGN